MEGAPAIAPSGLDHFCCKQDRPATMLAGSIGFNLATVVAQCRGVLVPEKDRAGDLFQRASVLAKEFVNG